MFYYKLMVRKLSLALGLVALCALTISGSRKPKLSVSFHLEGHSYEQKFVQEIKLGNPPKSYFFRKQPELTQRHIVGYYPFPSNDGKGYGAAFKLNENGTNTLSTLSITGANRKLLTVVNGEPIDHTILDKPVNDGTIVVWGGLTKAELALFDKKFRRILPEPSRSSATSRAGMPERATERQDDRTMPPIIDADSATEKEPKKKGFKLFNFGKNKDES